MTSMNKVFADLPVTIFEAMSQLARDNNADQSRAGLSRRSGSGGYPAGGGGRVDQRLQSVSVDDGHSGAAAGDRHHYEHWHGLDLDPMTEVMVTSGGTEALTSSILAVVEPGDEVVVLPAGL